VAVNSIYASVTRSYKYNLVLKSFSYGTQVMGHPVQPHKIQGIQMAIVFDPICIKSLMLMFDRRISPESLAVEFNTYIHRDIRL
jgi:hypothetical protein